MSIGTKSLTIGTFNQHLLLRRQKRARFKRTMFAGLTLTSMVDMFSLLVIFLLQTFSATPEMVMVSKNLVLPRAASGAEMEDAPVLALDKKGIYLDQKWIGTSQEVLNEPSRLTDRLNSLRETWEKSHPGAAFRGVISLQADEKMNSTIVSQIMAILPSQNYATVQLAVISRGGT